MKIIEIQSYSLFFSNTTFNQPISNWNVNNVKNMYSMFNLAKSFNQPLNNWDVSNINTYNMFVDCPIKEEYEPKFEN